MKPQRIKYYQALGWEFTAHEWNNGHNGGDEITYRIKSPRLHESFSVTDKYNRNKNTWEKPWIWMTELQLLTSEIKAYVDQRLGTDESDRNYQAVLDAARKALLSDPDAKRITFTVKLK